MEQKMISFLPILSTIGMIKDRDSRCNDMVSIGFSHRFSTLSFLLGFCISNEIEKAMSNIPGTWGCHGKTCHQAPPQQPHLLNHTTNYYGVVTNTDDIDTSSVISGHLTQRVRND